MVGSSAVVLLIVLALVHERCSLAFSDGSQNDPNRSAMRQKADQLLSLLKTNPNDFSTLYALAAAYLALNEVVAAKNTLMKVIDLKPEFHSARLRLANIELRQGLISEAEKSVNYALSSGSVAKNEEETAYDLRGKIESIKHDLKQIKSYTAANKIIAAARLCKSVLRDTNLDFNLWLKCADLNGMVDRLAHAIKDFKQAHHHDPNNPEIVLKIASHYKTLGQLDESLFWIRQALKIDPDNPDYLKIYKNVKSPGEGFTRVKSAFNNEAWDKCKKELDAIDEIMNPDSRKYPFKNENTAREMFVAILRPYRCHCSKRVETCEHLLNEIDSHPRPLVDCGMIDDVDRVLILREISEILSNDLEYEKALESIRKARDIVLILAEHVSQLDPDDEHISDKVGRDSLQSKLSADELKEIVEKELKEIMEKKKQAAANAPKQDYYKLLGVSRKATTKEINKAYRKLAKQHHPDLFQGAEKEKAEKKFRDLTRAKEVLSNPENRKMYDSGVDPSDPMSAQQQQARHPFHQAFNFPFSGFEKYEHFEQGSGFHRQGNGFTFRFHF